MFLSHGGTSEIRLSSSTVLRREIVSALNKEINAALADPEIAAKLASLGATVLPSSPAGAATLIDEETEKWRTVVKFSGAKSN